MHARSTTVIFANPLPPPEVAVIVNGQAAGPGYYLAGP